MRRTIDLVAGESSYDFPDDIEPGQIFSPLYVRRVSDQRIFPLRPGINWLERNAATVATTNSIPRRYTFENQMIVIFPTPDITLYDQLVFDAFTACTDLVSEEDMCSVDSEALIQMAEIMVRPRIGKPDVPGAAAILAKYLDSLTTQSGDNGECLLGGATSAVVTPEGENRLVNRPVGWDEGWNPNGNWGP